MPRPNFFCDLDALNYLAALHYDVDYDDIDLTVDIIEVPLMLIYTSDDKTRTLRVMRRGELHTHSDSGVEEARLTVDRVTGDGTGTSTNKSLSEKTGAFLQVCRNLACYLRENELESLWADLDPEKAGIRLRVEDGELDHQVVSGKARPDLMCATLFGGVVMCRPYMEDFMARSELEFMSPEEKAEAAEAGDTDAMEQLAMYWLNGDEAEQRAPDGEKAVYWFRKLAEAGSPNGMFNLGLHYAKGFGVPRDFEQAAQWMQKAADAGDADAPALVEKYRKIRSDEEKANAGDVQAMADLAGAYMSMGGSLAQAGPGEDYRESLRWANAAADRGNGDAIWCLALAYEHGRGVPQDREKARACYQKGAELGHAPSQHSLGCLYANGDGVEQSWQKAFALFQKSAAQGYGLAMRDLGRCYQFGNGCAGNMKTAVEWYEKALTKIDDPELARKTALFKQLAKSDPHWGEDYAGPDADAPPRKKTPDKAASKQQTKKPPEADPEAAQRAREKAEQEAEKKMEEDKKRAAEAEKEAAYKRWQEACKDLVAQRRKAVNEAKKRLGAELREKAGAERDGALQRLDAALARAEAEKKDAETALAGLGIFQGAQKKLLKDAIARIGSETLPELEARRGLIEQRHRAALAAIDARLNGEEDALARQAEKDLPDPPEPPKPESVLEKERARRAALEAAAVTARDAGLYSRDEINDIIVEALRANGPMTIEEMLQQVPELEGESNQHLSALCRALYLSGRISKYTEKRRTYFKA